MNCDDSGDPLTFHLEHFNFSTTLVYDLPNSQSIIQQVLTLLVWKCLHAGCVVSAYS